MLGKIDLAHAPGAEQPDDPESGEGLTTPQGHRPDTTNNGRRTTADSRAPLEETPMGSSTALSRSRRHMRISKLRLRGGTYRQRWRDARKSLRPCCTLSPGGLTGGKPEMRVSEDCGWQDPSDSVSNWWCITPTGSRPLCARTS